MVEAAIKSARLALSRRLIRLREIHGLTLGALAGLAGVAVSTLNEIETGESADPKVTTILRLCAALEATPDGLLGFNEPKGSGCPVCAKMLEEGRPHGTGECVRMLSEAGRTVGRIATVFGLAETSVHKILEDEYEALRLRRR